MRRKKRKKARYENVLELCMSAVNLSNSQTAFKEKGLVGAVWVDWFSLLESREQPRQDPPRAESSQRKKSLHPTSSQISNSLERDLWIYLADIQLKDGELNWARSWRCIAGLSKLVFWASWRSTESGNALKVDVVTENIYLMFEFYINFLCAAKAGERHSALVLNIGTFTEEEFLNMPRTLVPFIAMFTWILDSPARGEVFNVLSFRLYYAFLSISRNQIHGVIKELGL